MDIELAELQMGGARRDVIPHSPKNGSFHRAQAEAVTVAQAN